MMELRQAGKNEVQGGVQSADNPNTGATYSTLQVRVIIEVQKTLYNTVLCLYCVVRKFLNSDQKWSSLLPPFL